MTRYALITGASSGIGLAMAEALARRGRNLILVARQRDRLESIAIELTQRFGVEVLFRACDLGEPLRLSGFLLELEEGERQIDLLVNCAGIGTSGPFLGQDWMTEQDLIEVNILALTRLCHAIGNSMALLGGGPFLPIHWGTFSLAMHAWDQPAEVLLELGPKAGAELVMPRLGEPVEPSHHKDVEPWWRSVDVATKRRGGDAPRAITLPKNVPWPLD